MEIITCINCNTAFKPSPDQLNFISSAKSNNLKFIMLSCPNCGLGFGINPFEETSKKNDDQILFRTPISGSHGFISIVNNAEGSFYGCGETGAIWRKEENLIRDVKKIIELYPHRKLCYIQNDSTWVANQNEPENIEELINTETEEIFDNFERD